MTTNQEILKTTKFQLLQVVVYEREIYDLDGSYWATQVGQIVGMVWQDGEWLYNVAKHNNPDRPNLLNTFNPDELDFYEIDEDWNWFFDDEIKLYDPNAEFVAVRNFDETRQ